VIVGKECRWEVGNGGYICELLARARTALGAGTVSPAGVLPATRRSMRAGEGGYRRASSVVEARAGVAQVKGTTTKSNYARQSGPSGLDRYARA
jgi:hypothetical protein